MFELFSLALIGILLIALVFARRLKVPQAVAMAILFAIPIVNAIADSLTNIVAPGGVNIGTVRAILLVIALVLLVSGQVGRHLSSISIFAFLAYLYSLLWLSSDITYSVNGYLKISVSMLAFPLAIRYVRTLSALKLLSIATMVALLVLIGQLALAQIFKWGPSVYVEDSFYQGGAGIQVSYTLAFGILLAPMLSSLFDGRGQRLLIFLVAILSLVAVILLARRISYIALLISFTIYILFSKRKHRFVIPAIATAAVVLILWPAISPIVDARLGGRLQRLSPAGIQEETRFVETIFVFNELATESLKHSLIGTDAFNSSQFFTQNPYQYPEFVIHRSSGIEGRMLHVDYNQLLFGTGIVGLLFYLVLIGIVGWHFTACYRRATRAHLPFEIRALFWSIMAFGLVISISGSLFAIGYRFLLFMYLGAFIGFIEAMSESAVPQINQPVAPAVIDVPVLQNRPEET